MIRLCYIVTSYICPIFFLIVFMSLHYSLPDVCSCNSEVKTFSFYHILVYFILFNKTEIGLGVIVFSLISINKTWTWAQVCSRCNIDICQKSSSIWSLHCIVV
jgi:hypothetical protein